jgi:hypothetical protein
MNFNLRGPGSAGIKAALAALGMPCVQMPELVRVAQFLLGTSPFLQPIPVVCPAALRRIAPPTLIYLIPR